MDIDSPNKRRLLHEKSKEKTKGVVDLRCFAETPEENTCARVQSDGKIFREIKSAGPAAEKNNLHAGKIAKERAIMEAEKIMRENSLERTRRGKFMQEIRISKPLPSLSPAHLLLPAEFRPAETPAKTLKNAESILDSVSGPKFHIGKSFACFVVSSFMVPVIIFSFAFAQTQIEQKTKILGESAIAYGNMKSATEYAMVSDFTATQKNFESASMNFSKARDTLNGIGLGIGEVIAELPVETPLSTAQNLALAGQNLSLSGKSMGEMLEKISAHTEGSGTDYASLGALAGLDDNLQSISGYINAANDEMQKVDPRFIPEEMRDKIIFAKNALPAISDNFKRLSSDYPYILKMLGSERQQKYLLLFENNSEMRATGGFIGSYGIIDIENGKIKDLQIDDVFNPDGQLKEKIIPPMPIQKISAAWSMHDSNWFADFPTSAKTTALFYEKTGGPTVDGVIAVTPETIKKLLEITGPIDMPAYGITITAENFIAETQNQVEDLYDKQENKPKKILSDLALIMIDKLFKENPADGSVRADKLLRIIQKLEDSLQEKQILIYHRDDTVESMLQKRGWAGEIMQNQQGDYLLVINSNINGYKTDAVMDESIKLDTEIKEDGTVINTLTIKRKHLGGDMDYDWYNRVNADYMRVYVPKGSILLDASGNTVEQYVAPMDYKNFKTDPNVEAVEKTIKIDPQSQTQIFEESGKTVFGNWVYVSPHEEATVIYRYQLPFKIDFDSFSSAADSYSAIIQKQAGSIGSNFETSVKFPSEWKQAWKTGRLDGKNTISEKLTKDLIHGMIFTRN